jgi:hypothetical protein
MRLLTLGALALLWIGCPTDGAQNLEARVALTIHTPAGGAPEALGYNLLVQSAADDLCQAFSFEGQESLELTFEITPEREMAFALEALVSDDVVGCGRSLPADLSKGGDHSVDLYLGHADSVDSVMGGPSPRRGHQAVALLDGRVLVVGGDQDGQPQDPELITLPEGSSEALDGGPRPILGHTLTLLPQGQVLVLGGVGADGQHLDTAWLFDPQTDSFDSLNLPDVGTRSQHTATALCTMGDQPFCTPEKAGLVLVAGGRDNDGALGDAWVINPLEESRQSVLGLSPRRLHAAVELESGQVLLAGGFDEQGAGLNDLFMFAPDTTQLSGLGSSTLRAARAQAAALRLADGSVLFVGGASAPGMPEGTLERFSPATESTEWVATSGGGGAARVGAVAARLEDGRVAIAGGGQNTLALLSFGSATSVESHLAGGNHRGDGLFPMVALADGTLLLIGGENTSGITGALSRFSPCPKLPSSCQ